ncbi:peptidoglycan D,D-transpeptidase FtsI family protein [Adlercreutzia aquisgranensis]|uniref:peptidoglycan D,D-transpeptidase FtsI family protein n=1 Tax=Adlercreutzia aquisgranensis TaxID=2941323 RepID=UPI0020405AC4|nr:penicillin-binding protein 2 [Adlercreutzia aquisgranensis]
MAPRRSSTSYRGTASPLRPASARPRTGRYDNLNLSQRTVGSSRRSSHASASRGRTSGGGGFQGQGRANAAAAANPGARMMLVLVLLGLVLAGIAAQLVLLQVFDPFQYRAMAVENHTSVEVLEPRRGTIYDRNGTVLAISVDAVDIYVNPSESEDPGAESQAIASVLGGDPAEYLDKLTRKGTYQILVKKVDPEVGDAAKALGIDCVHVKQTTRREYPQGEIAGQVVGACSLETDEERNREYYVGLSGIEAYYDSLLSGTPGTSSVEVGLGGLPKPGGESVVEPAVDGQDIVLSIDLELQKYVQERLVKGVDDVEGTGGSAIVMDSETGEIYAAASLPFFNPADRTKVEERATELRCITDTFEPGSIFKTVSMLSILENTSMTPDTEIFCPSYIQADIYTISDAHERGDATFTLREILDKSSNVGISLATEQMGFRALYDSIVRYNLNSRTGVDFPGEGEAGTNVLGWLGDYENWDIVKCYNASFGQGLSVTPLQMTRFYGALINDGVECTPHFLMSYARTGETVEYPTTRISDDGEAIDTLVDMLGTVVSDGTGTSAAIEGYTVAGKTATGEIYDEENGGYREGVYNLAFTGFLPNSSSRLVCFVGANEVPGDRTVAPVFRDIMAKAIDRFRISPEES